MTIADRIIAALVAANRWMTSYEIAEAVAADCDSVRSKLSDAIARGKVLASHAPRGAAKWYAHADCTAPMPVIPAPIRRAAKPAQKPSATTTHPAPRVSRADQQRAESIIALGGRPMAVAMAALAALEGRG